MFRHLILVRHASAEDRDWMRDDFARALTDTGHFQAKTLAQLARTGGVPKPDAIFTSGYRRAEETMRYFYGSDELPVVRDACFAPEGSIKRSLQLVHSGLERVEAAPGCCAWIVGHNPHIEFLLDEIAPRTLSSLGAVQKGSLIWLEWEKGAFAWGEEPRLRMLLPKPKMR